MMKLVKVFIFMAFSLASLSCESAEFDSGNTPLRERTRTRTVAVPLLVAAAVVVSLMPEPCYADAGHDMMARAERAVKSQVD